MSNQPCKFVFKGKEGCVAPLRCKERYEMQCNGLGTQRGSEGSFGVICEPMFAACGHELMLEPANAIPVPPALLCQASVC